MSDDDEDVIHEAQVLNAPETIWLVVGELDGDDVDFHECEEITWCDTDQFKNDIRYTRATPLTDAAPDLLKALEELLECNYKTAKNAIAMGQAAIKKARGEE
jgi:hypothetical protein